MSEIKNNKSLIDSAGPVNTENDFAFYETIAENWFVALPYGFRITFFDKSAYTLFLPISPNNLSIRTNFATNMIPTLYGTVEEHSDVRYFDIAIEGTTGMQPKFSSPYQVKKPEGGAPTTSEAESAKLTNAGRKAFSVAKKIPLGGFFAKTLGALAQAKKQASDLLDGGQKENETGVDKTGTGYVAFHNLYKMLLRHKRDASGGTVVLGGGKVDNSDITPRTTHPIVFFNYKDGNQYNVVIKDFTMKRSAENPMLYYYSITMRGYKLSSIGDKPAADDQNARLNELGLNAGGSSVLGQMKQASNSVKGILGSLAGGINILGR